MAELEEEFVEEKEGINGLENARVAVIQISSCNRSPVVGHTYLSFLCLRILLAMRNEINCLRAFLSVNTVFDGIRFRVILSKGGATNEDLKGVGEYVRDMMMAHRPQGLKTLNEDARLLEFVDGSPWDVEWLNEGERGISGYIRISQLMKCADEAVSLRFRRVSQGTQLAGTVRRNIEVTNGQVNHVGEVVQVAISGRPVLDDFDNTIQALTDSIG